MYNTQVIYLDLRTIVCIFPKMFSFKYYSIFNNKLEGKEWFSKEKLSDRRSLLQLKEHTSHSRDIFCVFVIFWIKVTHTSNSFPLMTRNILISFLYKCFLSLPKKIYSTELWILLWMWHYENPTPLWVPLGVKVILLELSLT